MKLLDRLRDLLRKAPEQVLTTDTPGLSVVAEAFDIAEADSAVLARSHLLAADRPAVLRHHLRLPGDKVAEATGLLAQDGWELRPMAGEYAADEVLNSGFVQLHALRVQQLDALHCAQERSRMAGLAQRLGGDSLGWDALQPSPEA
ncbi:hypothetical protein ORV05_05650 [Amycolatopsis cynarae]|uniref:Uncharacterized protein n=1 Tax=Amycolatopsis cynarae TaxID=2995223 RepID=A0ABY7B4M2_9PSEU|nr:hypothetical protein [Amycolatopsis sp. HUAS 11-8]WAL67270.1 hypothetical protein ORV05_05650 [Amycolatopsis sp. HUAS 11-8]